MANTLDIDTLGKNISDDFVTNGKQMTESLIKVAQDCGLNKHQIHRVAEVANVETYLSMMSKSAEKYIKFPVADPEMVSRSLSKKAEISDLSDYNNLPESITSVESIFSALSSFNKTASIWSNAVPYKDKKYQICLTKEAMDILSAKETPDAKIEKLQKKTLIKEANGAAVATFGGKSWDVTLNDIAVEILKSEETSSVIKFNKLASLGLVKEKVKVTPSDEASLRKTAQIYESSVIRAREALAELSATMPNDVVALYNLTKQACLSYNYPNDVLNIIKVASNLVNNLVVPAFTMRLQKEAMHLDYEKVAELVPDPRSSIFTATKNLEEKINNLVKAESDVMACEEKYANFVKENKLANLIGKNSDRYCSPLVTEAIKEATITGLGAAFIAGSIIGNTIGVDKGKAEQGRVLQKAMLTTNARQ